MGGRSEVSDSSLLASRTDRPDGERSPRVVPDDGDGWTIHYRLFARAGFTEATQAMAAEHGVRLIDLDELGRG